MSLYCKLLYCWNYHQILTKTLVKSISVIKLLIGSFCFQIRVPWLSSINFRKLLWEMSDSALVLMSLTDRRRWAHFRNLVFTATYILWNVFRSWRRSESGGVLDWYSRLWAAWLCGESLTLLEQAFDAFHDSFNFLVHGFHFLVHGFHLMFHAEDLSGLDCRHLIYSLVHNFDFSVR